MEFLVKKFIGVLLLPFTFIVIALTLATFFALLRKQPGFSKYFAFLLTLLLLLASNHTISTHIIMPLEREYHTLDVQQLDKKVRYNIVVLGGGAIAQQDVLTDRLTDSSLRRTLEGIRIYKSLQSAQLIFTGSPTFAKTAQELAIQSGVSPLDILLETSSRDTKDHPRKIKPITISNTLILVTSAAHMRRAVKLFEKQNFDPIPAPVDFLSETDPYSYPSDYLPNTKSITRTHSAVHEYMGLAWAKIRNQI